MKFAARHDFGPSEGHHRHHHGLLYHEFVPEGVPDEAVDDEVD